MDEKQRMIMGLQTVLKQYESEIATDKHSIAELLRDPGISPPGEGESVSYGVHKIFHHLGTHMAAKREIEAMLIALQSSESDD